MSGGTAVALDHVGVAARELAPLAAAYERLGFTLSPVARQSGRRRPDLPVEPFGTGNRCALLRHGYVELIALLDPALHDNGLGAWLERHPGAHILALAMDDAEANLARLRRAGLDVPGVAWLERPVDAPDGPRARFARLPLPDAPEGRLQLIHHLTPELVWQPRWMTHANRAESLTAAILAADAPAETAARLSRLAGLPVEPDPAGGYALVLPGRADAAAGADRADGAGKAGRDSDAVGAGHADGAGKPDHSDAAAGAGRADAAARLAVPDTRLRILSPDGLARVLPGIAPPALPAIVGLVIRTDDGTASARRLLAERGVPARPVPDGLLVPPECAGGAALVFAA